MKLAVSTLVIAAASGAALGQTSYDTSVTPGWFVGSGQPNAHFVVNDGPGVQTGLNGQYRFGVRNPGDNALHDYVSLNNYGFRPGESFTDGTATMFAPGTASWNVRFHANLDTVGGSGLNIGNTSVLLTIDWDPTAGTDTRSYNLSTLALALGSPASTTLLQDSQNLGFSFWNDPGFLAATGSTPRGVFDPNAVGMYNVRLDIISGVTTLSTVQGFMHVPSPGAAALAGMGGLVAFRRRRR